jgi:hypothetical protein
LKQLDDVADDVAVQAFPVESPSFPAGKDPRVDARLGVALHVKGEVHGFPPEPLHASDPRRAFVAFGRCTIRLDIARRLPNRRMALSRAA